MPENNIWDVSKNGLESIRELSKNLDNSMEQMNQAFVRLNNTYVCSIDGMGIYADSVSATLKAMKAVNEESKASLEDLKTRLNKYAGVIEAELAKRGEL